MYVCICHALTEGDVESAARNGASHETEVFGHYGVKPQCGRCVASVKCLMNCARCPVKEGAASLARTPNTTSSRGED